MPRNALASVLGDGKGVPVAGWIELGLILLILVGWFFQKPDREEAPSGGAFLAALGVLFLPFVGWIMRDIKGNRPRKNLRACKDESTRVE